jgi:hypothetical protein
MSGFEHMRGDTFAKTGTFRDAKKKPLDLSQTEVFAKVETPDQSWSEELLVNILDQTSNRGVLQIQSVGTTDNWPVGVMRLIVWRVVGGAKRSLKPALFNVIR